MLLADDVEQLHAAASITTCEALASWLVAHTQGTATGIARCGQRDASRCGRGRQQRCWNPWSGKSAGWAGELTRCPAVARGAVRERPHGVTRRFQELRTADQDTTRRSAERRAPKRPGGGRGCGWEGEGRKVLVHDTSEPDTRVRLVRGVLWAVHLGDRGRCLLGTSQEEQRRAQGAREEGTSDEHGQSRERRREPGSSRLSKRTGRSDFTPTSYCRAVATSPAVTFPARTTTLPSTSTVAFTIGSPKLIPPSASFVPPCSRLSPRTT